MKTYHMQITVSVEAESEQEALGKPYDQCSEYNREVALVETWEVKKVKPRKGIGSY